MKSSISVILCCAVIYGEFSYLQAQILPYVDFDSECTLRDLKNEKNLNFDFPMPNEPSKCRLTWSQVNESIRAEIKLLIERHAPSHAKCLSNQFEKSDKAIDLVLTITAIRDAHFFSETEKKDRLVSFRNEMRNNLEEIANECQYPTDKFIDIFRMAFVNNETLIDMESTHCLAKYVTDKEILTLPGVILNPFNINIKNLNCSIVIDEEMGKDAVKFRENMTLRDETAIACVMNVYRDNEVFNLDLADIVLAKLEMPQNMRRLEKDKIEYQRAILAIPFQSCYDMDKDYPYA